MPEEYEEYGVTHLQPAIEAIKPSRAHELIIELLLEIARIRADRDALHAANTGLREQLEMRKQQVYDLQVRLGEKGAY